MSCNQAPKLSTFGDGGNQATEPSCSYIQELSASGDIFQPIDETPCNQTVVDGLSDIPALESDNGDKPNHPGAPEGVGAFLQDLLTDHRIPEFLYESSTETFDETFEAMISPEEDADDLEFDIGYSAQSAHNDDAKIHPGTDTTSSPVSPGHFLTVGMSLTLILLFSIVHVNSAAQLQDLLTLVGLHCMQNHPAYNSIYKFKSFFSDMKSPVVKHYYCKNCFTSVDAECVTCPNKFCLKTLDSTSKSYHLQIPVAAQLQTLFKRKDFIEGLKYKQHRHKKVAQNIEDIYDGEIYSKLSQPGEILSLPFNISFTWNTDGVPVFKSSKLSLWPIYLMVNELPPKMRKKRENMVCAGFWFGESKPFMPSFCSNLHSQLKEFEENGLNVTINDQIKKIKTVLICGTADLPARSAMLNMVQFNGKFGCLHCKQQGSTWRTEKGGNVHIFPFQHLDPAGPARTHRDCARDAIQATREGKRVNGLNGPSFLLDLKYYDFVHGTGIDYMHGVLLGITKRFLDLWFSTRYKAESFSLVSHLSAVDAALLKLRPPHFVTRTPRAISEHLKFWKANEFRAWLFYYSIPIVMEILPNPYLYHYAAFVQAISVLCKDSISRRDIEKSNELLVYVVQMFGPLYGDQYITMNVHALLHLADCVTKLGPLWVYSCFAFESLNGDILKLVHGTQAIEMQIASAIRALQNLPEVLNRFPEDSPVYSFVLRLRKQRSRRCMKHLDFHIQALGKHYVKTLSNSQYAAICTYFDRVPGEMKFFNRIMLRQQIIHSQDYVRVTCRNSFTIEYFHCGGIKYGMVVCYISEANSPQLVALIDTFDTCTCPKLECDNFLHVTLPLIHKVQRQCNYDVVPVEDILGLCVCVSTGESTYVCKPPNLKEED